MYPIKQSTTITVPFYVHDVAGDAVTGATFAGTKRISKGSGAFAAITATTAELDNGWYTIALTATHTDTLGILSLMILPSSGKQVNLQFRVHVRIPDDLAFPSVSGRSFVVETDGMIHADLKEWLGVAPLALVAQRVNTSVGAMAASVLTAAATAADHIDLIWDELLVGHVGADSAGLVLNDWQNGGRLDLILDIIAADVVNIDGAAMRGTDGVDTATMRGTDSAALASVCTELRLAELDPANLPTDIADIPTVSEFNARTILSAAYFDPAADTVVNVTNVAVLTGHTNQTGDSFARIGAAGVGLSDLGGMSAAMQAEVLAEVNTALDTAITELTQAQPTATPSIRTGLMLMYMAMRNKLDVQTSGTDALEIHDAGGTMIARKLLTDAGGDYSEALMVAGV